MSYLIKKIIIFLAAAAMFVFGGFFIYKAYQNYKNYQIAKNSDQYISTIIELGNFIKKIEQERLMSALYLGYDGKIDFNTLKTKREHSDKTISHINSLISKNSLFVIDIDKIQNNLQYVRSRVDVISREYEDIFFKYYQKEILQKSIDNINELSLKLSSALPDLKSYLQANNRLIRLKNNLNLEQSFVLLLLSRSQKVSMHDIMLWERILQMEKFPILSFSSNSDIDSLTRKKLQPKIFEESLRELRARVLRGVGNRNFSIRTDEWIQKLNQKIKQIEAADEIAIHYLKTKNRQELSSLEMIINLLIAVSLFVVVLFLSSLLMKKKKPERNPDIEIKHIKKRNESLVKEKKSKEIEGLLWDDLPLTNMQKQDSLSFEEKKNDFELIKFDQSDELTLKNRVFHPIEEFKSIIKFFVNQMSKKGIDFNYYIDPAISHSCIGDIDKIREIITIFLEYAFENTPSKGEIIFKIENIAQKESLIIINFVIENSGKYMNEKLRREILREASSQNNKLTDLSHNKKRSLDLYTAAKLISFLGGNLQIEQSEFKGTHFCVSLNIIKSKA